MTYFKKDKDWNPGGRFRLETVTQSTRPQRTIDPRRQLESKFTDPRRQSNSQFPRRSSRWQTDFRPIRDPDNPPFRDLRNQKTPQSQIDIGQRLAGDSRRQTTSQPIRPASKIPLSRSNSAPQTPINSDSDSRSSSPDTSLSIYPRPLLQNSITDDFRNALITDPTLKNLSQNAITLLNNLLDKIDDSLNQASPLNTSVGQQSPKQLKNNQTQTSAPPEPTDPPELNNSQTQTIAPLDPSDPLLTIELTGINNKLTESLAKLETVQNTLNEIASQTSNKPIEQPKSTLVITPANLDDLQRISSDLQALPVPEEIQIKNIRFLQDKVEVRASSEAGKRLLKQHLIESKIAPSESIQDKSPRLSKIIFFNIHKTANQAGLES